MGDIITTFAQIGSCYLEDEKRVKNKACEYTRIKVYLFDIKDKSIEVSLNISYEDLIITRFGVGANSGNLFPNIFFDPKEIKKDFDKFVKAILKANKNFLSYFDEEDIQEHEILKQLLLIDDSFIKEKQEKIENLTKYEKQKGEKGKFTTYFALSYKGKPISSYFIDIYEQHLNSSTQGPMRGYDFITNQEGIGGDANLAFCSTNELPAKMKSIKFKLLPLSHESAKQVKIGFDVMDKMFSHNFYGLKMAIMPTLLTNDSEYQDILKILEKSSKGEISEIRESEYFINDYLEDTAYAQKGLPVLNTILFYAKNNAAVDVLLQIDDVLPSYISYISESMGRYNIKAFKNKDEKDAENTIYIQNIFSDRLEIMNLLLSSMKIEIDLLVDKFSKLIYWGTMNRSYGHPVEWGKYFNEYYFNRSIEAIERYVNFFNNVKKLKSDFILQKEIGLEEIKDNHAKIEILIEKSPFLDNDVLKSAYLLGMLSSALMNWQYGVSGNSSYEKWLNNSGSITKDSLDRIWKKSEETIRKLNSTSGSGNKKVNQIKELVIASLAKAVIDKSIVKSSYVSLAFAMGGSDFIKYIKEESK